MENKNVNKVFRPILEAITPNTKDGKTIIKELSILDELEKMAIPSLDPEAFDNWENIKKQLIQNRHLDIEWDQVELLDKLEGSWRLEGLDDYGRRYEAIGIYHGDSLEEIKDIEQPF